MPKNNLYKLIVIVGPTASGKSDLAIKIAKKFNGEIISADSRQVYHRLDIGTGKVPRDGNSKLKTLNSKQSQNPKSKTQNNEYYSSGIRHYLIDVVSPKKQFTADDFKKLGEKAIKEILAKNKIPVIVGGTGFYIDILLGRMSVAEVPPNLKLRRRFDKLSAEHLFKMLRKLDPERAKIIEPKNKRRLVRALEVAITLKKSPQLTSKNATAQNEVNYKILWIGIKLPKKTLENRIEKRLDQRLRGGMIKEVVKLHKQGVSWKRLYDFGLEYRWVSRWLKSSERKQKQSFSNSQEYENLLRDIIKYSKRQMTWFKRNTEIRWVRNQREAGKLLQSFL